MDCKDRRRSVGIRSAVLLIPTKFHCHGECDVCTPGRKHLDPVGAPQGGAQAHTHDAPVHDACEPSLPRAGLLMAVRATNARYVRRGTANVRSCTRRVLYRAASEVAQQIDEKTAVATSPRVMR